MNNIDMIRPHNLKELAQALNKMTESSKFLAGGTDLVLEMNEGKVRPDLLVDVSDVEEMIKVEENDNKIIIGGSVTFTEIAEHPLLQKNFPALTDAAIQVGSKQIRNRGTLGGNLGNGSPAGDSLAPLVSLGAEVNLLSSDGSTSNMSVKDFLVANKKPSQDKIRVITAVVIEIPGPGSVNVFLKLGSRKAVSIARLSMAVNTVWDETSKKFSDPVIVLGALGKQPILAHSAEKVLAGNVITPQLEKDFAKALAAEVDKAIPTRSTRPYKHSAIRGIADDFINKFR